MIRLYGFRGSNYYNIVKLTLLEKGLDFEEVPVKLGPLGRLEPDPGYLAKSPIAKVPALETGAGVVSETNVILEYLDELGEGPSFFPADPFEKAKVREIMKYLELYVELPARRLYGELSGRPVPAEEREVVRDLLERGFDAVLRLARFDPWIAGKEITVADFYALFTLGAATFVAQRVYGWDAYHALPGVRDLLKRLEQRPTTKRIRAEDAARQTGW